MKKFLAVIAIAGVFTACGNENESTTTSDSTIMMETPDTTNMMMDTTGAMMGDTTTMMGDSIR